MSNQTSCGACVKLNNDEQHCGACNDACLPGEKCKQGACECEKCTKQICGGVCVNTKKDEQHCGGCFDACAPGKKCNGSKCK